jgi:hypothetical protein
MKPVPAAAETLPFGRRTYNPLIAVKRPNIGYAGEAPEIRDLRLRCAGVRVRVFFLH